MDPEDDRSVEVAITRVFDWSPRQRTVWVERPRAFRFVPGQFARVGVRRADGGRVARALSMCSAPWDDALEFLVVRLPGGPFSGELWTRGVGDTLWLDKAAQGFLTLDRFVGGRVLWMLATGTGLAPFVAILRDPAVWQRFEQIVVVHGVREATELAYRDALAPAADHPLFEGRRATLTTVPLVTRDPGFAGLRGRIPALLASGELEAAAGVALDPESARVMVCGGPQMVEDTHRQLMRMGLRLSRLRAPAQIALENGW